MSEVDWHSRTMQNAGPLPTTDYSVHIINFEYFIIIIVIIRRIYFAIYKELIQKVIHI